MLISKQKVGLYMYSKQEQNLILYQKAKQKITIHLILYSAILCIYFFLMAYLFSNINFLKVDDPSFHSMLLKLTAGQLILYGITFVLLSLGNKWFRILYWIDLVITLLLIYFPIHLLLSNLKNILPFFILIACMLLKTVALSQIIVGVRFIMITPLNQMMKMMKMMIGLKNKQKMQTTIKSKKNTQKKWNKLNKTMKMNMKRKKRL